MSEHTALGVPGSLTAARRAAGLTQSQVARELNVKPNAISRYEHGTRKVDVETVVRLASLYGTTVAALLGEVPSPPEPESQREEAEQPLEQGPGDADLSMARLLGLMERLESDVRAAIGVAAKNAETATQMSKDVHALVSRVLDGIPRESGRQDA